jgi:hypothetical protein
MRILLSVLVLYCWTITYSQVHWPKSYSQNYIDFYRIIQEDDGGFLTVCSYNNDGNSYLIKFDANGDLLWKKCLKYSKNYGFWATSLIKDKNNDIYITGNTWDTDSANGDAFIIKLDSCYNKTQAVIYTDTIDGDQQYFGYSYDFSDSLFFIEAWGFNKDGRNDHLIVNKKDLSPLRAYNSYGGSGICSSLNFNNAVYFELSDYFHLKGGDTSIVALRGFTLKLEKKTGDIKFYKFFGYDNDILTIGINVFNSGNQLHVFCCFVLMANNTIHKEYCPMMIESDTNGNMISYKFFDDSSIQQDLNNVLKFNDSIYIMAIVYRELNTNGNSYKIKFIKSDNKGNVLDSFYMNNWGRKFFYKPGAESVRLFKTSDNKIMCVFNEKDTFGSNARITFLRFDENFKLDTTEYRNIKYNSGCNIKSDTMTLDNYLLVNVLSESIGEELKLHLVDGIAQVPAQARAVFYPNPVKNNATFEFENINSGPERIILTDSKGSFIRELYYNHDSESGNLHLQFDLSNLCSGIYFITVYGNDELRHTIRLVKE